MCTTHQNAKLVLETSKLAEAKKTEKSQPSNYHCLTLVIHTEVIVVLLSTEIKNYECGNDKKYASFSC
jgi:hypothetical protein